MPNPTSSTPITRSRRNRQVSALTAHQAQHKRDLDRKTQRALRQRVKSRLQDLEDDLARAKADCSVRERNLMKSVQSLRDENRKLRSYLDSIGQFALNWAAEGGNGDDDDNGAAVDEAESPIADLRISEEAPARTDEEPRPVYDGTQQEASGEAARAIDTHDYTHPDPAQDVTTTFAGSTSMPLGQMHVSSTGTSTALGQSGGTQHSDPIPPPDEHMQQVSQSLPQPIMTPPNSTIRPVWPSLNLTLYQPQFGATISSVLPKHTSATCPLDQILLDFIDSRRSMLAKGYDIETVLGPLQPSLQAILHPGPYTPESHPASRVLGEVLTTFPHVGIPQKLGFMFIMYRTMRWQISPTDINYEGMPRWLRPTATQITVPHPAWIDNIPWPRVRDLLIEQPDKYPFAVFSELYSQNVTVNWPYDDMDAVSTHADNVQLNQIFEKHVRKLSNWTVLAPFQDYLPEMIPAIYGKD
ncbi:hypothetical protein ASPVEDRAFT_89496 [Aspergillus versicolor CBS 583.65]|uniref:BZIP domain-containing protein n=1 Tax=Aspergillus versicolor CBS 583.65 TaxID=1036611 RepID=A0A1L9Q3D8_ASPVE|nr:uncharacterized protein ASPVEDRAFT_89496 [Aspergillus versicolor CBS 583.65]OJJ08267.1 hypothetical protein ASPVEDRAFT_89496 [Aspergillus versicolor CBS 583.65]